MFYLVLVLLIGPSWTPYAVQGPYSADFDCYGKVAVCTGACPVYDDPYEKSRRVLSDGIHIALDAGEALSMHLAADVPTICLVRSDTP